MTNFYLCVLVLMGLVIWGGYEGTMNVFAYGDLKLRYWWILRRLHHMRNKYAEMLGDEKITFAEFKRQHEEAHKL